MRKQICMWVLVMIGILQKTGESNSVMLAQTDNLPEKALVYGVLGEKAVVSTTIGIPTGKILSYDTYKEAQSIGVEKRRKQL